MSERIIQGVMKVTYMDGSTKWFRLSRVYFNTLIYSARNIPNFKYCKIFPIENYKKGTNHQIGKQIGYITLNGSKLDFLGLVESKESQEYKRNVLKK